MQWGRSYTIGLLCYTITTLGAQKKTQANARVFITKPQIVLFTRYREIFQSHA